MSSDSTSNPESSPQNQRLKPDQNSLQPFDHLPDELLLPIFRCLDPIKRSLFLSICRKWNDTLLKNHSLWNSLVLEYDFSFEETLSILRLFNSRSGYQLKHVCLGADIARIEDSIEIIEELKKSAASLRVLGLVQKVTSLNKATRKLARLSFPKLNTFDVRGYGRSTSFEFSDMFDLREELGINDLDEEMRYLRCGEFLDSDEEKIDWLSGLKYLELTDRCSSKDLKLILNASKSSLKCLDLSTVEGLASFSNSENSNFGAEVDMTELETLYVPWFEDEAVALGQMLGTTEKIEMTDGKANCLGHFNLSWADGLEITLYDDEDRFEKALINSPTSSVDHELLLRNSKSVNQLTIWVSHWRRSKVQLDLLFKLLIIPSIHAKYKSFRFRLWSSRFSFGSGGKDAAGSREQSCSRDFASRSGQIDDTGSVPVRCKAFQSAG